MVPSARVSEHARYRERLGRLAAAEFGVTVADVACRRGWVEPGGAARRTYGRFDPSASPWATLVYALGSTHVRVDVFDEGDDDRPADALADPAGAVRVSLIDDVGPVAGLRAFLRDHPDAVIVRYRPGRRCVLRVGDRFVKLVRPDVGVRLHDAGRRLWAARAAGLLPFRVAEPDRWDDARGALWQGAVAGAPITPGLATTRRRSIAHLVGASLAALATAPLEPSWSGDDPRARTARAGAHVVRRVPELGGEVTELLARLSAVHAGLAPRPPVPVHGAASPDQWLDDGETLGLVDFDRFSWGDVELDAATFLGALDFDTRASVDDLEAALLDGFGPSGYRPDALRLAAYRADVRLRKVARTAMAVRPDGDERAARHLRAVAAAVEAAERRG
jgi:hypothetical protein